MNRLWIKLSLAFLGVSLAAIGVVAVVSSRATGEQFKQYVVASGMLGQTGVAQDLTDFYAERGSWDAVGELLANAGASGMGMGMGRGWGAAGMMGANLAVADSEGVVVASRSGELVGERLPDDVLTQGVPLVSNGKAIGTLLNVRAADVVLDPQGEAFLGQVRSSLVAAALLAAALSLVLGVLLSRWLTAPLAGLTRAAQAIASGDLAQRVPVRGRDEIGALGDAFNQMSTHLADAELLRKNLIADVSHELRTPLAVVQGNLQAILDGVYPLEMTQVAGLYDETRLLTRLVDDLHELALADAGQLRLERVLVNLADVAHAAVAQFAPTAESAGVRMDLDEAAGALPVMGDAGRLAQVLRNLLGNALRHTPPGGAITVRLAHEGDKVRLSVADTGAGIAAEDLPHVFERFYRGDKSRGRRGGGAGLGLAIARQWIAGHDGSITVESAPGAGATFTMTLPAARVQSGSDAEAGQLAAIS